MKNAKANQGAFVPDSLRTLQYISPAINYYNPIKIFILFAALCVGFSLLGFFHVRRLWV